MGSGYRGEPNLGNDRGNGSSSGSSSHSYFPRKAKKTNSEKPRQPQRGLGVAQLEKIRLNGQMGCVYNLPSLRNPCTSTTYNKGDHMRAQAAYSSALLASLPFSTASSSSSAVSYGFQSNIMMNPTEYERFGIRHGDSQPTAARWDETIFDQTHLIDSSHKNSKKQRADCSQNSESSETQDLDLELRLSL